MVKIFVIGNIGSGKSTFCEYLTRALGEGAHKQRCAKTPDNAELAQDVVACNINLDKLGHDALENAEVKQALKAAFGPFRTRIELGKLAFQNPNSVAKLNDITHPFIYRDLCLRINEAESADLDYMVVEQTVVAQHDDEFLKLADVIICVSANKIFSETPDRVEAQLSMQRLQKFADIVVENNADLIQLESAANSVATTAQNIAKSSKYGRRKRK